MPKSEFLVDQHGRSLGRIVRLIRPTGEKVWTCIHEDQQGTQWHNKQASPCGVDQSLVDELIRLDVEVYLYGLRVMSPDGKFETYSARVKDIKDKGVKKSYDGRHRYFLEAGGWNKVEHDRYPEPLLRKVKAQRTVVLMPWPEKISEQNFLWS